MSAQTLDRGLRILEILSGEPDGLPVREVAGRLGVHRTIVYRLLGSLLEHRLVARAREGRYRLGTGLVELARAVAPHLQAIALPELSNLAESLGATAFLTVADGEEAVALAVMEPRTTHIHVAYRAGFRHPLDVSSAGVAILAGRPPRPGERKEIAVARRRGFAASRGELQRGAFGIAAPLLVDGRPADASVGVVTLDDVREADMTSRVVASARSIAAALA